MLQVDYVEFYNVLVGVTSAQEVIMSMSDEVLPGASSSTPAYPSVARTQQCRLGALISGSVLSSTVSET